LTEQRKVEKLPKESNCSRNKKNERREAKEKIGLQKEARVKLIMKYCCTCPHYYSYYAETR
jgi:hypothetical protein